MQDIKIIRKLRKKLGLTQKELAQRAGVSQSLIAKIETGKIDPSYTNAKQIFDVLNHLDEAEYSAKDMLHPDILSIKPSQTLKEAIKTMRENNISQMPVMKHNKVVGYISESVLLERIIEGDHSMKVGDIMKSSPPIIPPDTKQGVIANLLQHFPFVLVEDRGRLIGIIAKADLLRAVYN